MIKKAITVQMDKNADAKPIAMLVQAASQFESDIHLKWEHYNVNAKSIMGMMMLKLVDGEQIQLTAEGRDELEAMQHIEQFLMCVN